MTEDLREVPLADGPIEIRGALETVKTAAGTLPRRLPEWTRAQYQDSSMERQATSASGVRLAFRTAATVLELDVLTTVPTTDAADLDTGLFELCVGGEVVAARPGPMGNRILLDENPAGVFVPGAAGTVRFDGLPSGAKDVEIWLPQWVKCELVALRAGAAVEAPAPTDSRVWLHHGSSISQCNGADSPTVIWPALAARKADVELVNVGLSGNCFLDPFVARSIRDAAADLISLKLGINLTRRGSFNHRSFGPAVHGFLDTVREGHPDAPLLVVSPIFCPASEDTPAHGGVGALTLRSVRSELRRIVAERAAADPDLHYLDGLELLGPAEAGLLGDGLHPTQAGNQVIGERFASLAFGAGGPLAARWGGPEC